MPESDNLQTIRAGLQSIPDLYQNNPYSKTGLKDIDEAFIKAEDISNKIIETIDVLKRQIINLKKNIDENKDSKIQYNLIEMISTKIDLLNSLILTINTILEDIITFTKEVIKKSTAIISAAADIKNREITAKILLIQDELLNQKDMLTTLKEQLSSIKVYYNLMNKNKNQNYNMNIKIECQKKSIIDRLDLIKNYIMATIIKKETKIKTKLLQTRYRISEILQQKF